MDKKQVFVDLFKAICALLMHCAIMFSPLMLIAGFIFIDDFMYSYPALFKGIVALTIFNFIEMGMELYYAGKCKKDPKNMEKYIRQYLEKTATYYFESDKERGKKLDWYIERWSKNIRN